MKNLEFQKETQISGNIITRLDKDEFVSMETIAKTCDVLGCGVDDFWNFQKIEKDMGVATKANMKEIPMEEVLWKPADTLRRSVEPSEYKT